MPHKKPIFSKIALFGPTYFGGDPGGPLAGATTVMLPESRLRLTGLKKYASGYLLLVLHTSSRTLILVKCHWQNIYDLQ